jgi:hypothetical protein
MRAYVGVAMNYLSKSKGLVNLKLVMLMRQTT